LAEPPPSRWGAHTISLGNRGYLPRILGDGRLAASGPDHAFLAVAAQAKQESSTLAKCRRLVALRQSSPALRLGSFEVLQTNLTTLVFIRRHNHEVLLCGFNFGAAKEPLEHQGEILAGALEGGHLAPDGYVILRLQ